MTVSKPSPRTSPARLVIGVLFAALVIGAPVPVRAQDAGTVRPTPTLKSAPDSSSLTELPPPSRTRHTVELPGRSLSFTAVAGAHTLRNQRGVLLAEMGYTAYILDDTASPSRPLVFAFNGGPGSASTWLHLGALGPWRLPLTAETIATASATLSPNAETWLDVADLVFLDPPGTGVTRVWPAETAGTPHRDSGRERGGTEWFWSIGGDIQTFVEVIRAWVDDNGARGRPIVLVGESYGGFRAPLIAAELAGRRHAISISSMILVSPVLDFDGRRGRYQPQHFVALLPSLAATHLERSGVPPSRETMASVESYARGDFLLDLMRGARDAAAVERLSIAVAGHTGLSVETVRSLTGRVSAYDFLRASPLRSGLRASLYDAGMVDLPSAAPGQRRGADPFTSGFSGPLSAAMTELMHRLSWQPARPYLTLAGDVTGQWRWQRGPNPPEALSALASAAAINRAMTVLVTHGFTDLATPYFASAIHLDHLPLAQPEGRVRLEVYPGGHMFYSRDASRIRFRADAERAIKSGHDPTRPRPEPSRETP